MYKKIISYLIVTTLMFFCLSGCVVKNNTVIKDPLIKEEDMGVCSIQDNSQLLSLIGDNLSRYVNEVDQAPGSSITTDAASNDDLEKSNEYETNSQVKGIDEGDIVKVDGNYIYYLTGSRFLILKEKQEKLEVVLTEDFNNNVNSSTHYAKSEYSLPIELYHTDDYIIVITQQYRPIYRPSTSISKEDVFIDSYYFRNEFTNVMIYQKSDYTLYKELSFEGTYNTSRLVDNELYLISSISSYYMWYTRNKEDLRPLLYIDNQNVEVPYEKIKYLPEENQFLGYTTIVNINLQKEVTYNDYYFIDDSLAYSTIYFNNDTLYFISYFYNNDSISNIKKGDPYIYLQTKITAFDFYHANDEIKYGGSYIVDGNVTSQYWVDDNGEEFRIMTTGRVNYYNTNQSTIFNYLYILERKIVDNTYIFEEVSSLKEGIGKPNEQIKSVRFNGNMVTVVTFVNTDPLYYIDLTDPKNPVITSELEISGYSIYQHPYKDNYVIGIGYEVSENNRITGIKVALYDITNKDHIMVVGNPIVISKENAYSYGFEASYNPKAFMFNLEENIFGFSTYIYNSDGRNPYEYYVFKIDMNCKTPLSVLEVIEYQDNLYKINYLYGNRYWYYGKRINRMVYIGNKYYALADCYIEVFDYQGTEFKEIQTLVFK